MKEKIKKISSDCEYLQSLFIDREARMNQEEVESSRKALEIIEIAERKMKQMEMELKDWKDEQERIAATVTFDNLIHLNVGGYKFDTTVATMTRFPDSMLGAMFSGRHQLPQDKDGYYFIDQDGTHFRHIINFLRNPDGFVVTIKGEELAELRSQAAYYLLVEKMFPFVFEKLPPQTLPIYLCGRNQYVTVKVVQDLKGIWKFDIASYQTVQDYLSLEKLDLGTFKYVHHVLKDMLQSMVNYATNLIIFIISSFHLLRINLCKVNVITASTTNDETNHNISFI